MGPHPQARPDSARADRVGRADRRRRPRAHRRGAGKRGGRPFVARWGKYFLVGLDEIDAAERFFARWGNWAVLIGRLLPVIRTFIAFPAGVARMPLVRFHIYTFIGSWPWCFALAWVGMKLGVAWRTDPRLSHILHRTDFVVVGVVVAAAAWFVWHKVRRRA